ncbi:MAG TPA: hypothetical protein VH186_22070 [Chloroflexia bacterium]|nr:hypothetical protein [Chloroflexia bacterium]
MFFKGFKPESRSVRPWYMENPGRLLIEQQAMASRFPQFQLYNDDGQLYWIGKLETNRNNSYLIKVNYPDQFPSKPPEVFPVDPVVIVDDPKGDLLHQYPDGKLCLYYPGDRTFPSSATAATVVAVAAAWFFCYETWLESGKQDWPGAQMEHQIRL